MGKSLYNIEYKYEIINIFILIVPVFRLPKAAPQQQPAGIQLNETPAPGTGRKASSCC